MAPTQMELTENVLTIVAEYTLKVSMKLLNWIDESKLDWSELSRNPAAIHLLDRNQARIDWEELSRNLAIFAVDRDAYTTLVHGFVAAISYAKYD